MLLINCCAEPRSLYNKQFNNEFNEISYTHIYYGKPFSNVYSFKFDKFVVK